MIQVVQTPEMVQLYIKQWDAEDASYLRFQLLHNRNLTHDDFNKRHDVWRMNQVFEVAKSDDGEFQTLRPITNAGEWETAVREVGAGDSLGGRIHGNEFLREAELQIDGSPTELEREASLAAQSVRFTQRTRLTRYNSENTNVVAEKRNVWHITAEELLLEQELEWLDSMKINRAFLTMLPVLRKEPDGVGVVTDTGARAPEWEHEDIAEEGFGRVYTQAHHAKAWSDVGRVSAEIEVVEGWNMPNRRFFFSDASIYNKMYFDYSGSTEVVPGDVWRTKSIYRIKVLPR